MGGNIKLIIAFTILLCIGLVSSANPSFGVFKINEDIEIVQLCYINGTSCDFCNITSIDYPNGTRAINEVEMTKRNSDFNYTFNKSNVLGEYRINGYCGYEADVRKPFVASFDVTQSGAEKINEGEGITLSLAVLSMIIIAIIFFTAAVKIPSTTFKIILGGTSMTIFVISILFILVIMTELLGGYINLIEGYSYFWMVMKVILSISVLGLLLFAGYVSFMYWKKHRGLID
ncbi:hypothetical protein GF386_04085 [Candidatus Pacearchaeota archaeon]|nr:hypothetical protein [Candidatus Pacearchaeota archaeon]